MYSEEMKQIAVGRYIMGESMSCISSDMHISVGIISYWLKRCSIPSRKSTTTFIGEGDEIYRKCSKCNKIKKLTMFETDPSKSLGKGYECRSCHNIDVRFKSIHKKYNLSKEDFLQLAVNQNYSCAICGINQDDLRKSLSIDHCHVTNVVRGLLCSTCNSGIGMLKDDVSIIISAAKYLSKFK